MFRNTQKDSSVFPSWDPFRKRDVTITKRVVPVGSFDNATILRTKQAEPLGSHKNASFIEG